jgi:hypothetical protein
VTESERIDDRWLLTPAERALVVTKYRWSDAHLHRFRIHGKAYGLARCGGIDFVFDPFRVQLAGSRLRRGERLSYAYDFTAGWIVDLRLEGRLAPDPESVTPRCTAGRRAARGLRRALGLSGER